MENEPRKPTRMEIFNALTSEGTTGDWDMDILRRAKSEDVALVRKMVSQYDYRELGGYFLKD